MGAAGQSRLLGLRAPWKHRTILLDEGKAVLLAAKNNGMESFHRVSKYVLHLILNPAA